MEERTEMNDEVEICRIRGTVVHGFGRGSTLLGYPTANIETKAFSELMSGKKYGVYFGWARVVVPEKYRETNTITDKVFKAVISFGKSVQFDAKDDTLEAYIIHTYDGVFYDYELRLVICGYIRPMYVYASIEDLIHAIDNDVQHAVKDTVKSRQQSSLGFWKAQGFKNIYSGQKYVAVGSFPSGAIFFLSYETCKEMCNTYIVKKNLQDSSYHILLGSSSHILSASIAETIACLSHVPTENIKQRYQVHKCKNVLETVRSMCLEYAPKTHTGNIYRYAQPVLYRGFWTTVLRDGPFAALQFPIYEYLRVHVLPALTKKDNSNSKDILEAYISGGIGGGISAVLTTPLDVIKTRIMLGVDPNGIPYNGVIDTTARVYHEGGQKIFFSGVFPRFIWLFCGSSLFLGSYELMFKFFINSMG